MPSHLAINDRSPRQALAELAPDSRAKWRTKYLGDDGAELRALAILERAEAAMRAAGNEVTIRTLWMTLADQAAAGDSDTAAAAAIAGVALGLAIL